MRVELGCLLVGWLSKGQLEVLDAAADLRGQANAAHRDYVMALAVCWALLVSAV